MALRTAGWILGAPAHILHENHLGTVTAITECEFRTMPARQFSVSMQQDTDLAAWLREQFAREIREQLRRASAFASGKVRDRLDWLVPYLFQASHQVLSDGSLRLGFPLSVTTLADMLGVSRQAASAHLAVAVERGLLVRAMDWWILPATSRFSQRIARQ